MSELETRLRENLSAAADVVPISGDAWQQNQRRIVADATRRRSWMLRTASVAAAAVTIGVVAAAVTIYASDADKKKSDGVPAISVPIPPSTLLLPEELPRLFDGWRSVADGRGEGDDPDTCQRQTLRALGATRASHRTFISDVAEPVQTGRQVVARFPSKKAAADAFDSYRGWFAECRKVEGLTGASTGALTHADGRFALVTYSASPLGNDRVLKQAGVAVHDDSVTVLSITEPCVCNDESPDRLAPTMRVALDRLSARRTWTADAVPEAFRFWEERSGGFARQQNLFDPWLAHSCRAVTFDEDARRTGMLSATAHRVSFQLAVYEDVSTAAALAARVRSHLGSCNPRETASTRRLATAAGAVEVTLDTYDKDPTVSPGAIAQTAVQLGKAVLLVKHDWVADDESEVDLAEAQVLRKVATTIDRNRDRICAIAGEC